MTLEETVDLYCTAWSEPDQNRRGQILREVAIENLQYTDPRTDVKNCDQLIEHIAGILADRPGARVVRTSAVDEHHGWARFAWHLIQADGTTLPEGLDVIEVDEETGKLKVILGFFGSLSRDV